MSFASGAATDLERKILINLQIQNCYKSIPILTPPKSNLEKYSSGEGTLTQKRHPSRNSELHRNCQYN
jgi:hypothetical protein